jgi:hypothetical protein
VAIIVVKFQTQRFGFRLRMNHAGKAKAVGFNEMVVPPP